MAAIGAILGLLGFVSLFAIIKPFGPYKKRWHALLGGLALIIIGSVLMPPPSSTPDADTTDANVVADQANTTEEPSRAGASLPPPSVDSRWRYSRTRDEMRNADTVLACIDSTNELEFDFPYQGGSQSEVCFWQSPQFGFDAWVRVDRGQFTCFMECRVSVKFGDDEIREFSATGASDGSSDIIFISNADRFLRGVTGASEVIVEAEFYQAGLHQMVFEEASGLRWPPEASAP